MKAVLLAAVVVASFFLSGCPEPVDPDQYDGLLTAKWFVDRGPPADSTGEDGDLYLDQDTMMVYVKTDGAWVSIASLQGAAGTGWLFGSGAPSAGLGSDGDLYLDIVSTMAYRKVSGAWSAIFELQGDAGTQWFSGQGDPADADPPIDAAVGDMYLDTLTAMIYERVSGGWVTSASLNISEPQYVFTPLTYHSLMDVGYGAGLFIAVGDAVSSDPGVIMSSADGTDWEYLPGFVPNPRISGPRPDAVTRARGRSNGLVEGAWDGIFASELNDVAWGNGLFVAVGHPSLFDGTNAYVSTDALDWQSIEQEMAGAGWIDGVAYLNGIFVATGYYNGEGDGPTIWTSDNGYDWSSWRDTWGLESMQACAWGGADPGVYVAVGDMGTILVSPDAAEWTQVYYDLPVNSPQFYGIAYANGSFVVVGGDSYYGWPLILRSEDGYEWSTQDLPCSASGTLVDIAAGNGGLIAVGNDGSGNMMILRSPNGYAWSVDRWPGPCLGVGYGEINGGLWVIVGAGMPS